MPVEVHLELNPCYESFEGQSGHGLVDESFLKELLYVVCLIGEVE